MTFSNPHTIILLYDNIASLCAGAAASAALPKDRRDTVHMEREYKMSAARAQELQEELNYLKTTRSDEVAEQIKVARGFGDLSENSEYDEAKNEQGKLYSRIAELEEILQHVVIVDESSSFKSHKAKRFKALASVGGLISRMVELTGTPSPNGLEDLWAQMYLLDGGERLGKRYTQFRERYFQPDRRGSDGMVYSYEAKPGTQESILQKISDICISMKAEDYLQLPDVTYHQVPVTLDAKAEKAYREMERKMVLDLPEDEEQISVASAAALSNKLLQLANGALYDEDHNVHEIHGCKLEAFLELIESLQGKPALVFYNFQHDRQRILRALEKSGLRIRELKTTEDEDAWNRREVDVLLTHPASSAYGLNLQQGGNHVVWFGLTWNYELYTQANKRLHRQGQQEKVIIHHLVCAGTRDEDVMKALERKEDVQEWVMQSLKARIKRIKEETR